MRGWTVIGGWALGPEVLRPVFGGEGVAYVDVNRVTPLLVGEEGALRSDWRSRARDYVSGHVGGGGVTDLAGWSTGALVAVSIAADLGVRRLVLLSAAAAMGWPATVLRRMRQRLSSDRRGVVRDFLSRAGAPEGIAESPVPAAFLSAGLFFLEHYPFEREVGLPGGRVVVFHGRDDRILPAAAGREFAGRLGAPFEDFPGGHLFFLDPANAAAIRGRL